VRITAHLIDALTDQHLWSETYERDLRDVLWLQNEVAAGIAREIRVTLTPQDQARLSSAPSLHPETQEFYLKGRYYWHKWTEKGWRKSCDYFEQAIRKDPGYALAYAGLAQTQCQLGLRGVSPPNETWPKAKRAAQKALEIDHLLADARTALGVVNAYYDWNWQAAEESFKSAIDISPSFAFGHRVYAIYLAMQGRFDKAIEEVQRSQQHDPLSLHIILTAGFVFYFARRYDEAIEQYQRILEMDPYFAAAHWLLGECYLQKGRCEIAIEECEKALALSEDRDGKAALGHAYGLIGKREEATKIANHLESEFERTYVHPGSIALVYTGLGDTERALQWLETAYQWRSHSVLFAMIDPRYDSLRSDRRFTALMQRLGLPPSFKSCGRRTLL
jgi:tetratricopeptide (TPR) repeat protein